MTHAKQSANLTWLLDELIRQADEVRSLVDSVDEFDRRPVRASFWMVLGARSLGLSVGALASLLAHEAEK